MYFSKYCLLTNKGTFKDPLLERRFEEVVVVVVVVLAIVPIVVVVVPLTWLQ
jgi:hypothetical protein